MLKCLYLIIIIKKKKILFQRKLICKEYHHPYAKTTTVQKPCFELLLFEKLFFIVGVYLHL